MRDLAREPVRSRADRSHPGRPRARRCGRAAGHRGRRSPGTDAARGLRRPVRLGHPEARLALESPARAGSSPSSADAPPNGSVRSSSSCSTRWVARHGRSSGRSCAKGPCRDRTDPRTRSRCLPRRAIAERPTCSSTIPGSSTSSHGACSRSRVAARTASPTTRNSSATPGASRSVSSRPPIRRYASGCWTSASRHLAATSLPTGPAGSPASTSRWHPRTTSALSARRPICGCSEAGSARRSRSPSRRLPGTRRDGRLPTGALLDRIGPVLMEGPAGTAKAGLDMVGRAGVGSPDGARRAAVAACDGLANTSPDVQRAALTLIGRLVQEPDDAVARAITQRLPDVAESQRAAASALLARLGGTDAIQPVVRAPAVTPAPVTITRTSPVDPARAIVPLTSFESLVDIAVSVLETGGPPDDLERVLDAVGRLAGEQPEGLSRLVAPVAKRARTILARRESAPFSGVDPKADIAAVLLAWATGELVGPAGGSSDSGAGAFQSARAREISEAAARHHPFVSVAAPTHRGGWIDPLVLVERLASREPASRLDLVAAVLRLAPDGRDAALGAAGPGGAPDSEASRAPSCAMRSAVTDRSVRRLPGGWLRLASGRRAWTTRRWSGVTHGWVPMPGRLPGYGCASSQSTVVQAGSGSTSNHHPRATRAWTCPRS